MSRSVRRAPAPLALMGLIFYLSAQPDPGPDLPGFVGFLAHFAEYFLLTLAWAWALAPELGRPTLAAAAISFAYALSDELHQSFVPGREADPLDVATDAAGIAAACLAFSRLRMQAAPRRRPTSPRSDPRPS